ncbi:MAG: hypothetical protein ACLQIB_17950, partial [Isosphaeraceae bacterium]
PSDEIAINVPIETPSRVGSRRIIIVSPPCQASFLKAAAIDPPRHHANDPNGPLAHLPGS